MLRHPSSLLIGLACLVLPATAAAQTPGPPTNLTVTPHDDFTVTLQWTPPSSGGGPTGYRVEVGSSSGASDVLQVTLGVVTTYRTTHKFTANVTYYFRVRAINGSGVSLASNEVALTIPCATLTVAQHVSWRPLGSELQVVWVGGGSGGITSVVQFGSSPGDDDILTTTPIPGNNVNEVHVNLPAGTYYVRVVNTSICTSATATSAELVVTAGEAYGTSQLLINEIGSGGENFLRFIELKNVGSGPINIQNWKILNGRHNVFFVASIPAGTTLPPGCTYLIGNGVNADLNQSLGSSSSAALVDPSGRIRDSIAARETESGTSPYVFVEGNLLNSLSTAGTSYARVADVDTNNNQADFVFLGTWTPQSSSSCTGGGLPPAPSPLQATVNGGTVTLNWASLNTTPPILQYSLEVGLTSGATDFGPFFFPPTPTSATFAGVPDGTYYARVRATNANGISAPTNEVTIVVCWQNCTLPPGPVTNLTFQLSGSTVLLAWVQPTTGGAVTGYVIEGGTAAGLSDLGQFPTESILPFVIVSGVPPGTYFVRVRAANGGVLGPASNEVMIVVP